MFAKVPPQSHPLWAKPHQLFPPSHIGCGFQDTLYLSHLLQHPGCSVSSKPWTPEVSSLLQVCLKRHTSGVGRALSPCALCYHPRSLTLRGLIFSSLLWSHLSEPQAGPLCGML